MQSDQVWSRLDSKQKFFITRPKSSKDPFLKNSASTEKRWFLALLMTWSIVQVHYELTYEVICLSSWLLFDQKYVNVCKYYAAVKNTCTYPEYRSYISILLTYVSTLKYINGFHLKKCTRLVCWTILTTLWLQGFVQIVCRRWRWTKSF